MIKLIVGILIGVPLYTIVLWAWIMHKVRLKMIKPPYELITREEINKYIDNYLGIKNKKKDNTEELNRRK